MPLQHVKVLRRFKFTPSPLPNKVELRNDIQQFSCKLSLVEYFYRKKNWNKLILWWLNHKKTNQFSTLLGRDKVLDQNIDSLGSLNFPDLQITPKSNFSKLEWEAINDLKNGSNVEIKGVGKGGSAVILSKSHYESMTLLQHNNKKKKQLKFKFRPQDNEKIKALITT